MGKFIDTWWVPVSQLISYFHVNVSFPWNQQAIIIVPHRKLVQVSKLIKHLPNPTNIIILCIFGKISCNSPFCRCGHTRTGQNLVYWECERLKLHTIIVSNYAKSSENFLNYIYFYLDLLSFMIFSNEKKFI